ncbi:MAG: OB-fold nucleic acid binding domain-containing protein, partial [Actinomycetota bacterium]
YHEQVMRVIASLTGCSLSEADKIRRNLDDTFEAPDPTTGTPAGVNGQHRTLRDEIVKRAVKRGWDEQLAAKIWDEVLAFASFGFCKAHAAAFAVPTYQSSWLKAHYPAEFYSGVLTHEPGMYPRRAILADARNHGITILECDVNLSDADYRAEEVAAEPAKGSLHEVEEIQTRSLYEAGGQERIGVRLGLKDVKGISGAEVEAIIKLRPWKSLEDFCSRSNVSRPVVEGLIHCGAFDSISSGRSRRELFWVIGLLDTNDPDCAFPGRRGRGPKAARGEQIALELFDGGVDLTGIRDYSRREKVAAELEVTGMDVSSHVMSFYLEKLSKLKCTPASRLLTKRGNAPVVVAGVKVATQTPPIKSGKRVIFLTLDDGTGHINIALFDEAQRKYARTVFDGWILAVKGRVRRTGVAGVSVQGHHVMDLENSDEPFEMPKLWHSSGGSAGR